MNPLQEYRAHRDALERLALIEQLSYSTTAHHHGTDGGLRLEVVSPLGVREFILTGQEREREAEAAWRGRR